MTRWREINGTNTVIGAALIVGSLFLAVCLLVGLAVVLGAIAEVVG